MRRVVVASQMLIQQVYLRFDLTTSSFLKLSVSRCFSGRIFLRTNQRLLRFLNWLYNVCLEFSIGSFDIQNFVLVSEIDGQNHFNVY